MAKRGLALPWRSDGRGRLITIDGEEQLRKIIGLSLQNLDSANPFQDLGLGEDMIFAVSDDSLQSELRRRIAALFRRLQLEDRARLLGAPAYTETANGELEVYIKYVNLETNKPGEFTRTFGGA